MDSLTGWSTAIDAYDEHMAAGGSPATTRACRRQHLEHAARRIPVGPWEVSAGVLTEYFAMQTWAQETRRGRRATMLGFYRWAERRDLMHHNPADALPMVPASQPRPRPAPDEVYAAALSAAGPRERLMLRLSAEVGLRRAEVAQVHARDLYDGPGGAWLTVHGKGRKDRALPLTPELAATLMGAACGSWLFPGADGGHLSPRWVGRLMADLLPDDWTMHALRHRFGTRAYAVDRDLLAVQALLGHSSPATTRVYVRLPDESLRATMRAVA